jgi:nuclear GTP-binding protein
MQTRFTFELEPKDPGIPNDFPYKDQILAEVAEERRQVSREGERA